MEVFEVVPNFFDFIDDIVKVDIKVVGEKFFILVFELSNDGALGNDHAAEVDDVFFEHEDVFEAITGMVGIENFGFEVVDVFAERVEKREARTEKVIGEHIKKITWAFGKVFFASFAIFLAFGEEFLDCGVVIVKCDDKIGADKDVYFRGFNMAGATGADRDVEDHKNVIVVIVDLRPLAFRKAIFEVEGMKFVGALEGVDDGFIGLGNVGPIEALRGVADFFDFVFFTHKYSIQVRWIINKSLQKRGSIRRNGSV